jgi:hypothetical protein
MANTTMTALLETCRAMTAKVTSQSFTLLPRTAIASRGTTASVTSEQVLGAMAMGYEAPPVSMKRRQEPEPRSQFAQAHDTRTSEEKSASCIAQQKAVFQADINHKVHADWEETHRHHTLIRQVTARRSMLA